MDKQMWIVIVAVAILTVIGFFAFQNMAEDDTNEPPAEENQAENEQPTENNEAEPTQKEDHTAVQHSEYQGELAPKFTSEQLLKPPSTDWITHGGDMYNRRYSTLEKINTSNVADLKLEWVTSLGSGLEFKYSAEGTPLVYDGIMFNITGADVVQAMDATTGEIIWEYVPQLADGLDTACCGWISRGVGIGDGKVYVGLLDSRLVALDQKTGKFLWETTLDDWEKGYTITAAPLYHDNKIYIGVAGGEYGIRGYMAAFDANSGREIWRTYTVPGPGETGHDTWPQDNDAWLKGGAPIWQTPAIDPELNTIYFSTGNASPDFDGSTREGDNLFSASILALDLDNGEYKWHFQEVKHDIWDLDAPNPVILFDVEMDGEMRKGVGQAGKTGWVYLLDRTNGKPLVGIEDRPVPQEARQKTAATQPYPVGDSFVPQTITEEMIKEDLGGEEFEYKIGDLFTPFWDEPMTITPSPQGGANWPPSAYNPETELFYVLGNWTYFAYAHNEGDEANEYKEGQTWIGSVMQPIQNAPNRGTITAIDVKTNKIVWQNEWDDLAYSGALTTSGDLLFVGHNDGRIIAYDATNGEQLWEFMTDAGANAPPMTYEVDGKQYISIFSGGNSLAGTQHGDKIYTFSLEGKYAALDDVPDEGINTSPFFKDTDNENSQGQTEAPEGDAVVQEGLKIYENNCLACHGAEGTGGHNGPKLSNLDWSTEQLITQVKNGGANMPPFEGALSEEEINAVVKYLESLINKK
ncbi:PQQ-binding-like beta-propeller repeat protein [Paucisalibacillus globulus]|uniref:outer membrane protein assembly factor BamB family protein n=1 Tax=Paucisalibacillus globulus TaxID=351095 RepID=UPI0004192D4A|nr:PQQ-binding-like beta-propeller repeat protein [Paucisalibacillus globulus]